MSQKLQDGLYAKLTTSKGELLLSLEYEKTPMTVSNFVGLAEGSLNLKSPGTPFYNGLTFHRVINDFMVQTGCPDGKGTGGPGYTFPDEIHSDLKHTGPGILSMANAGPGTNGSQFFITHVATPWLDGKHSVFGSVVDGLDIVNAIAQGDTIEKIEIIRVGKDAESFVVSKDSFAEKVVVAQKKEEERISGLEKELQREISNRWPEAKQTPSGLRYIVVKEGSGGASPAKGQKVTVHYTGTLMDGRMFDSSEARGVPAEFSIGQVIEGWNEALVTMKKGEKRTLIIPPELGYGRQGYPGVIPPNSYLIFDVELLDF